MIHSVTLKDFIFSYLSHRERPSLNLHGNKNNTDKYENEDEIKSKKYLHEIDKKVKQRILKNFFI